jgi:molybdopterin-guanine dinucleotide biosynthesis protein A
MAMVGAGGRDSGKTEFACALIRRFGGKTPIVALKVTPGEEANLGAAPDRAGTVVQSEPGRYRIVEETNPDTGKDTSRLLSAGAARVYWLRVSTDYLEGGLNAVLDLAGPDSCMVCESSGLRLVAEPGLFFLLKKRGAVEEKPSTVRVKRYADRVVCGDGTGFDIDDADIGMDDERWTLRYPATALVIAGREGDPGCNKETLRARVDALRPWFHQILVGCAESKSCRFVDLPTVMEESADPESLRTVVAGIRAAEHDRCLVAGCTDEGLDIDGLRAMLREAVDHDAVMPKARGREMAALTVYNRSFLPIAEGALRSGIDRIGPALERARTIRL